MASTYVNDLRLEEIATGEQSGSWGTTTNTNLELISEAFSYGSEAIANASTDTITVADGASDEARSFYMKCTGGGQACTVTLAPSTLSKVWMIENTTSYTLTFTQGSGANVAVAAGQVKMIATDGGGSGAIVYDLLTDVNLAGTTVYSALNDGTTTLTSTVAELNILDGATVVVGEINALDLGSTAVGTAIASKAVILDSSKDYTGVRNLTISGELDAATLDVSGAIDVAGNSVLASVDVTGLATAATFEPDGDTAAGDNAALGYTSVLGAILTGQGSTNDVTLVNDADATVLSIPTGTTNVTVVGDVTAPNLQGPAFHAIPSAATSIADSTWTKITYGTEVYDTNGKFASNRFTPTVAGYYQISYAAGEGLPVAGSVAYLALYKNGARSLSNQTTWTSYSTTSLSQLIYLDSNDYVEVYLYTNSDNSYTTGTNGWNSYFQGVLVRT